MIILSSYVLSHWAHALAGYAVLGAGFVSPSLTWDPLSLLVSPGQ